MSLGTWQWQKKNKGHLPPPPSTPGLRLRFERMITQTMMLEIAAVKLMISEKDEGEFWASPCQVMHMSISKASHFYHFCLRAFWVPSALGGAPPHKQQRILCTYWWTLSMSSCTGDKQWAGSQLQKLHGKIDLGLLLTFPLTSFSDSVDLFGLFGHFIDLFGLVSPVKCIKIPLCTDDAPSLVQVKLYYTG